jgi:chorismate mutase
MPRACASIPATDAPTGSVRAMCGWRHVPNAENQPDHADRLAVQSSLKRCLRREIFTWRTLSKKLKGAERVKDHDGDLHTRMAQQLRGDRQRVRAFVTQRRQSPAHRHRYKRAAYRPHAFVLRPGNTRYRTLRRRLRTALERAAISLGGVDGEAVAPWQGYGDAAWDIRREARALRAVRLRHVFVRTRPSRGEVVVHGLVRADSTDAQVDAARDALQTVVARFAAPVPGGAGANGGG